MAFASALVSLENVLQDKLVTLRNSRSKITIESAVAVWIPIT